MGARRLAFGAIGGAVAAVLIGVAADAEPAPARVEAPIVQTVLPDGDIRYSISVKVDGAPVEAMLDTGSTGLRLLPGAVPPALAGRHGRQTVYGYASGVEFRGEIVNTDLAIGQASSSRSVALDVVKSVDCRRDRPDCPASRVDLADFRIAGRGVPGQGFEAILGTNLSEADAANPLEAVGARAWIVTLPKPGDAAPGKLILNPDADDLQGFSLFKLNAALADVPGGFHDAVPGCLVNLEGRRQLCGPVLLDSGSPGIRIVADHPPGVGPWRPGMAAAVTFADGDSLLTARFSADGDLPSSVSFTPAPERAREPARVVAGPLLFHAFSVLYDPVRGVVGLKPR